MITGTATKEYALTALSMGIVGVASVIIADRNFVPMTVVTSYKNAVKKMGKDFVLIAHLRVRVCIDGRYGIIKGGGAVKICGVMLFGRVEISQ